ncbi:MAG: hypothetical protein P4L81_00745 [Candidatus Pacebacteria bacterium]|nr:hypothetical protein [Candidatus Paceibacterota bacterium]
MNWVQMHPYSATLLLVLLLLLGGAGLVTSRAPVNPTAQSLETWGGGALTPSYQAVASAQSPQQIVQAVVQNQGPSTLSLPPLATSSPTTTQSTSPGSFDYIAFLAQLSGNTTVSASSSKGETAAQATALAYQYIPTGLVATTAVAKKPMTAAQQTLHDYGNEVGGEIQGFENLHTNEAQILKDQAEDRTNTAKAAAVAALGQGFIGVGTYLQQMQDVPSVATSLHSALAKSYLDIGTKLQAVAQAQSDGAFIQAIENYDTSANTFVHNYGALAQFFSEQGVTFSPQDPGSIFSFTQTSGAGAL